MPQIHRHRRLLFVAILVTACSPRTPSVQASEPVLHEGRASSTRASHQDAVAPADVGHLASASEPASAASSPALLAAAPVDPLVKACPHGMVLVQGMYCPEVAQRCLGYLDPPGRYHEYRCREYARPATCKSNRVPMRFCIDVGEFTPLGQSLPAHFVSFREAIRLCARAGKRLCRESEWNFACEGEQMLPYPYGFVRDSSACHADRTDIFEPDGKKVRDMRKPTGQMPACRSPFGVMDMAGNLEELVALDGTEPPRPVMKGDWWHPGRNHCRARQTFHNDVYKGVETGFRCCADAAPVGEENP